MDIRTGFGYDIHRLTKEEGSSFLLAGVRIEGGYKIVAHSDGDILLHALSNAILTSLGEDDIGCAFPDNLKETEGLDSKKILAFALDEMEKKGYKLSNISVSILLEEPKLKPYRKKIKESLASLTGLTIDRIGLAANTGEGIGVIGTKQAIAVYANVLIDKD